MASSSSSPPQMKEEESRNWAELPPELTASILLRLSVFEILESAQEVCMPWRRVSKDPSMWRKIDMRIPRYLNCGVFGVFDESHCGIFGVNYNLFESMCRHAIDRSEGGLVEINIGFCGSDSLLTYIADRSSSLRSLGLEMIYPITNEGLVNAVAKLSLLEELEVSLTESTLDLKAIGHSCPNLQTLKLNCSGYWLSRSRCDDADALAIAESMPELRHLQLLGNRLTDTGLNVILDNCPHLEHLDVRQCLNINLSGDLEKRCLERIKEFRRPNDSTVDCPFYVAFNDIDSYDDYDDFGDIYGGDDVEDYYDFNAGYYSD